MRRILLVLALVLAGTVVASNNASAAEVAVNGGFETGSLSPWSCTGGLGSVVSTPVHSGTKALQGAASVSDNAQCTQTVAVVSGTSYTLSGWFRGNYTYLGITGGVSTWTPGGASYSQLTLTFTASSSSVQIYTHGWYGQGTYFADDISLQGAGGSGVPGAPGTLSSTGVTTTSISLAWGASSGTVTGYRVYEGTVLKNTGTGLSATISGLGTCTSHTYIVRAYNSVGESANSNSVTVSTSGCTGVPGAPGNNGVTGQTNTSISLGWTGSSGTVTGYRVYEGSTQRAQVTGLSATITGLGACTSHTYTIRAYNTSGESANSNSASGTTTGCTGGNTIMAAPYLYLGWGDPPSVSTVMSATGIKQFTMAFMLSGGGCTPMWDSSRPLTGGTDQSVINQIRANGGDIQISFGGWSGNKLGPNCSTPAALAGAYQTVINAYGLKYIDIDIENSDEFENEVVQDRILNALKIVKQNNPSIKTIITFGTSTTGPTWWGTRLINQAAALGANIDVFTIMPFDFGCSGNMYTCTTTATEGLKTALRTANPSWSDDTAYRHIGISGMNGLSDQQEQTTVQNWTDIKNWAQARHLARLAYWSVNRDRPCPGGGVVSNCSGIAQNNWQFTAITAGFTP